MTFKEFNKPRIEYPIDNIISGIITFSVGLFLQNQIIISIGAFIIAQGVFRVISNAIRKDDSW